MTHCDPHLQTPPVGRSRGGPTQRPKRYGVMHTHTGPAGPSNADYARASEPGHRPPRVGL